MQEAIWQMPFHLLVLEGGLPASLVEVILVGLRQALSTLAERQLNV